MTIIDSLLVDRYLARTRVLLRLIDPEDLGHLVEPEARRVIAQVLRGDELPQNGVSGGNAPASSSDIV